MRAALVQLNSGDDPAANLPVTEALVREAAAGGAHLVLTPECTNMVSSDRQRQHEVLRTEAEDATLAQLSQVASELGISLLIGSLLLKAEDDGRFVNRSFLVGPDGSIAARYDKVHMFDVTLKDGESYRESAAYRSGDRAVVADTADGLRLGMTICYDLRFPRLYRALAQAGAQVIAVPSAFTVPTGEAHWHPLLRARAIECGAYILAPAQWGDHAASAGKPRSTYGHSLAVSPWGAVISDAADGTGVSFVEISPDEVSRARGMVPSLKHDREFHGP